MAVTKINFKVAVPGKSSKMHNKSYQHEALIKKVQAKRFSPELETEVIRRIRSFPEAALGRFNLHKVIEESTKKVKNDTTRNEDGNDTTAATTE